MATIGATDLAPIEEWYTTWLGYRVVERGDISADLASSWGTPNMVGRAYILMQPESGVDVFIRAVETDGVTGYRPMTTFGWNSFEIIVDDVYALSEKLQRSPFEIIGGPESIVEGSTIHAVQVIGPSQEVLYLTQQTDPMDTRLPDPGSFVGRPFIMVLSGPDVSAIEDFYGTHFAVTARPRTDFVIAIIARALGLAEDYLFPMGFLTLGAPGHFIELDGYPETASPRPRSDGQLPPGNTLVSFSVKQLDGLDLNFISSPVRATSLAYGEQRSATFIGPAGELTELIENAR
jgi:catechol 2,3-dioxygenase-like lactoylglutathione lyase family enzyme